MKYRLCGLDLDDVWKQFGLTLRLKDAYSTRKTFAGRSIKLIIQNVQTSKLYK